MSITEGTAQQAPGWTADDQTFGARLALIRQRMGWGNVARAAKECGLPVDSWRNWEVDGVEPRRLTTIAMTIATATGCDYLWLVHGPGRGGSGGVPPTRRYAGTARVLATIGEASTEPAGRGNGLSTRPVRQTRPMRAAVRRPMTPVAV